MSSKYYRFYVLPIDFMYLLYLDTSITTTVNGSKIVFDSIWIGYLLGSF